MGDTAAVALPTNPAGRAHLVEDVRVAEELGVRYADAAVGRPPPSMTSWDSARAECVGASLAAAARRHHVPRAELAAVSGVREPWVDLLTVLLPMAALFVAASRAVARRLVAGHAPGERAGAAALLALLAPCAAALALGVTQNWGVLVEMARLGNGHISYRALQLPASRHGWLVWGAGVGLFAAVATVSLTRPPAAARGRRRTSR